MHTSAPSDARRALETCWVRFAGSSATADSAPGSRTLTFPVAESCPETFPTLPLYPGCDSRRRIVTGLSTGIRAEISMRRWCWTAASQVSLRPQASGHSMSGMLITSSGVMRQCVWPPHAAWHAHVAMPKALGLAWYLHMGCGICCTPWHWSHSYLKQYSAPSRQASHRPWSTSTLSCQHIRHCGLLSVTTTSPSLTAMYSRQLGHLPAPRPCSQMISMHGRQYARVDPALPQQGIVSAAPSSKHTAHELGAAAGASICVPRGGVAE
mmetsp:Transcript_121964/g.345682  ORF Transcript_121964/g.345682 Transcript_121964/m.345682 type:complete len:267 (-) Transcript_121964:99-899(-)